MNILVVGRGGREHSIIKAIAKSKQVKQIYVAPGNGGMEREATCIEIEETDIDALITFAKSHHIDLTIVGPENPLMLGIANRFQSENMCIFAPTQEAAILEGSKSFAKAFMKRHDIPTAAYASFTNASAAKQYVYEKGAPIVVKADGLAAGKGVVVAETEAEAIRAIDDMLGNYKFSEAGQKLVIEDYLVGKEFSLMAFVDGNNVYPLLPACDYKRACDGNTGPNTGGMGAFAPIPNLAKNVLDDANQAILQRVADGLVKEGRSFTGILYAGLIITDQGLQVIEFNARFGDPETQVVLPLLKNDIVDVFMDVLHGNDPKLDWEPGFCIGVVLASKEYPRSYQTGKVVPKMISNGHTFTIHAGTKLVDGSYRSDGGRVLLVGAKEMTLEQAVESVYQTLPPLDELENFFYRRDIGMLCNDRF